MAPLDMQRVVCFFAQNGVQNPHGTMCHSSAFNRVWHNRQAAVQTSMVNMVMVAILVDICMSIMMASETPTLFNTPSILSNSTAKTSTATATTSCSRNTPAPDSITTTQVKNLSSNHSQRHKAHYWPEVPFHHCVQKCT